MTSLPPDVVDFVTWLHDDAEATPSVNTAEALATLWLQDNPDEDADDDPTWSSRCVSQLRAHPEILWTFIHAALAGADNVWQVVMLAAGPLEDLIADHGATFIDRIEDEARRSPRFRFALTGVWPQGNGDSPLWARVEAARAPAMATGIDAGGPLPPA